MPYADHRGVRIYYQVEGAGPPLVLLHGFAGSLKRWYLRGYVDMLKPDYQCGWCTLWPMQDWPWPSHRNRMEHTSRS